MAKALFLLTKFRIRQQEAAYVPKIPQAKFTLRRLVQEKTWTGSIRPAHG